jgi:hypothetical protein
MIYHRGLALKDESALQFYSDNLSGHTKVVAGRVRTHRSQASGQLLGIAYVGSSAF